MHRPTAQTLLSLILIGSLANSYAAGPALGIAMANGSFRVGPSEVKGNASLFDGSEITTTDASSKLRFNNGSRMELGTGTQALVRTDRVVLQRGAGQVEGPASYSLDARTLRITPANSKSIARVRLDGRNGVLVSAVNGPVRVTTASGILLAKLEAGGNLRFEPQQGTSPEAFEVTGCLLKKFKQFILVETTTNQIFELRGPDQTARLGNRVTVKGTGIADAKPLEGAARVIQIGEVSPVAPGGCLATAASVGADALPGTNVSPAAAEVGAGANKGLIIAGVLIAGGAAAAIPLALSGKSKSQ